MSEEKVEVVATPSEEVVEEANVMEQVAYDPNAPIVTVKKLLEAGVHYGHQAKRWNPKMKEYIYCVRAGISLIDLNKSKEGIEAAYLKLKEIVEEGGKVLFVGTKDQSKEIVKVLAERSGSFYINNRWLGGILTNFKTIQTRIRKLKELELADEEGAWNSLPKKEAAALRKEKEKLFKNLEGIKEMRKVPNALIVVDPSVEHNAVAEANKLNIPVFAICDSNCDPDAIDYKIPGNDDAVKSVTLIMTLLSDAIVEAKGGIPEVAYTKDEGEEATMKDAIRQADRENALRLAARREMQREKLEKEKQRRAQFAQKRAEKAAKENEAAEPVAEEEAPEVEGE
jgi:small subunit ribosomal protein S2